MKALHIALWVAQLLLAAAFGMTGVMKAFMPIADLAPKIAWATALPVALVRFIGACELAGAVGLVLPAATRIKPKLTPIAAVGLATVMALAAAFHTSRGELGAVPINLSLGGLAAFVAWGRFRSDR